MDGCMFGKIHKYVLGVLRKPDGVRFLYRLKSVAASAAPRA